MGFETVVGGAFPGAANEGEFNRALAELLRPLGFTRESTLACLAVCRDEVSQSLFEHVRTNWGRAFNFASLAGVTLAGKTGFAAALAHGPRTDGRERYLFLAAPHVGMGPDGEQGPCEREGRSEPSSACGALLALLGELRKNRLGPMDDPDDVEEGLLRKRLGERASRLAPLDLFELTRLTHDVILEDLEHMLDVTVDPSRADYVVATGIQIHGPGMKNYIQPRALYAMVAGTRRSLTLPKEIAE